MSTKQSEGTGGSVDARKRRGHCSQSPVFRGTRILAFLLLPCLLSAAGGWQRFRSGPFEVLTDAGRDPGREALLELEQIRFSFGHLLGKPDLEAIWPFRVVIFSSERDAAQYAPGEWRIGRDAWMLATQKGSSLPTLQLVKILMEANTQRMPDEAERGLLAVLSTIRVERTRVTLGEPPPAANRDLAWARIHLLVVSPKYSGRVRVLFSNLQQGADWHSAYKNAFESTPEEMDAEVQAYLAEGHFPTRQISGAPIAARDFSPRDYEPEYINAAFADLLDGEAARAAYDAILARQPDHPVALEGVGEYEKSVQAGSRSARCYVEYGRQLQQPVRARAAWARASELNVRWAEPFILMAGVDTNITMRIANLRQAAELEPRQTEYWVKLAESYIESRQFRDAARAWGGAMRSASTEEERERYYQARLAIEEQRTNVMSAERRDRIAEREAEQRRLREEWAETLSRAREPDDPDNPDAEPTDVVEWWDDPRPKEKVRGVLKKVDCIGSLARLVVETTTGQTTQVLVRDPSQIVLLGGGEQTLGCGAQNPPPSVTVEYFKEPDDKLKTAGEATVIEFR